MFNDRVHRSNSVRLIVIILIGFGLRLYNLGGQSLWYDETVSAFLAGQSIPALIGHTARDIHPPGYYVLLHLWTNLAGHSEYALAFFSLVFGLLLIPASYRLSYSFITQKAPAVWAALLVALSPFNLWYSQEARMYTFGAFLGVGAAWCLHHKFFVEQTVNLFRTRQANSLSYKGNSVRDASSGGAWYGAGYVLCAVLGLYTLYYFAFLLIVVNLFLLIKFLLKVKWAGVRSLLKLNFLLLILYLPWLPIAWRQATQPPVPPWRTPDRFGPVLLESWTALSLGQSVEPSALWPILILILALFLLGTYYLKKQTHSISPALFLINYTFGPLLIIQLLSMMVPLYHVRYIFTYSPAFYILLGLGLTLLARQSRPATVLTILVIVGASIYAIYRYHFNPAYQADDYRAAVHFIEDRWQPGDVLLTNAGYTYTAYLYYTTLPNLNRQRLASYSPPTNHSQPLLLQGGTVDGPPQLGWGDPRSDFYAMSRAETAAALETVARNHTRLWMLRAYDTVTDPPGFIRTWLNEQAIPLEDQLFAGESNIRAQGFLLNNRPQLAGEGVVFADSLALVGWDLPGQSRRAGEPIYLTLGWMATASPSFDYKMSLKLWTDTGALAAQGEDTWPIGALYRTTDWVLHQTVYQPAHLPLPSDLPPGRYWLNVELYHPDTLQPLARLDGADPVVTLGAVDVVAESVR